MIPPVSRLVARQPLAPKVLLASADSTLTRNLERLFESLSLPVQTVTGADAAIAAIASLETSSILLLDVQLAGTGQLLTAIRHQVSRCTVALIAESVSDEWIAWLREGAIDDIIPCDANAASWRTHLSTMQRGHQLYHELEQLRQASMPETRHDPVTGLFHREAILALLFRETDRVQRLHGSLCLVLFTVDDFAHWTGKLGRDASGGLLREVADRTRRILRSYDVLGRTGPEEFLLVLPGCSILDAGTMAERLRTEVFGEFVPKVQSLDRVAGNALSIRLTACFGVTASRGRSPIVVLREAEQMLSLSRKCGPDTIRCASEPYASNAFFAGLDAIFPETKVPA
jgi:two-component system, cell cycle response regulator